MTFTDAVAAAKVSGFVLRRMRDGHDPIESARTFGFWIIVQTDGSFMLHTRFINVPWVPDADAIAGAWLAEAAPA